tara:strand:- start:11218 stop:12255 length:1038 start_codon:yes stop_codon:yes gene_type:complete
MVEFGIFNLMGYRQASTDISQTFEETVSVVKRAEEGGFEAAWFAEHHFSNYCVCPSPLLMVSHVAAHTQKIRLGPAVIVVPLYDPIRLLSDIGMASALCGNRLELGIGSGYQPYEFDRFSENLDKSKFKLNEFIELMDEAFGKETFSFQGEITNLPETSISTRPSHLPPIWIAGDSEFTHRMAAQKRYTPIITGRWGGPEYLALQRERIANSYLLEGKKLEECPMGILRFACVTENKDETMEYLENARYQLRLAASLRSRAEVMDGPMMIEKQVPEEPSLEEMEENLPVGPPEVVAEKLIADIRASGASHVMLNIRAGSSTMEQAYRTIDAFSSTIRPIIDAELH